VADQVQDSLFREIDEELRQEHYAKLWKRYGKYIIAAAVLLVVGVAGYQGWRNWDIQSRQAQSEQFEAALELKRGGDLDAARNAFAEMAEDAGKGYATLARFQEAAVLEQKGDTQGAVALYSELAGETSLPERFRNLAVILGALLEMDSADPAALTERLEPLTASDSPWRFSALEITAFVARKSGDTGKAKEIFERLVNDAEAPQGVRTRASEMLAALG